MEKLEKTVQSEGVDLIKSTIAYHTNLMQNYAASGDMEGIKKSAEYISLANEMGASERTELKERNKDLEGLSTTDALTGLVNRGGFDAALEKQIALVSRNDTYHASIAYFDIDHFKPFNDTYGHSAGDYVLSRLAEVVKENVRQTDIPCRYGGEEFAIIFPATSEDNAYKAAENLRKTLEGKEWVYDGKDLGKVTISVGIGDLRPEDSIKSAVDRADKKLYFAKENGRNQVVL